MTIKQPASSKIKKRKNVSSEEGTTESSRNGATSYQIDPEKQFVNGASTPVLNTDVINLLEEPSANEAREKIVTFRMKPSTYKKLIALQRAQEERGLEIHGKKPKVSESKIISDILDRVLSNQQI